MTALKHSSPLLAALLSPMRTTAWAPVSFSPPIQMSHYITTVLTKEQWLLLHCFSTESDVNDVHHDTHSPEPELLYYRGTEDQESFEHLASGEKEEMM